MKLGSPIVLTGSLNIAANSAPFLYDAGQLQAPNREAILIHEIRFHGGYPTGTVCASGRRRNLGPEARFLLRVGPYAINEDPTPMWLFGPAMDRLSENWNGHLSSFRWKLDRPLFVPPGMAFNVNVQRALSATAAQNAYNGISTPIAITMVGNVVTSGFPRTMTVPWVSSYAPMLGEGGVMTSDFQSLQGQLENSLNHDVEAIRVNGRLCVYDAGPIITDGSDVSLYSLICRMMYGNRPIIQQNTEFNVAFEPTHRTISLRGLTIGAGDRLLFRAAMPPAGITLSPQVALVAARKELA